MVSLASSVMYVRLFVVVVLCSLLAACASDSQAAKGAQQGAAVGALSGAVGGMVGALVFGGNVVEAGVQSAVVGGAVGATAGGMTGASRDKAAAGREQSDDTEDMEDMRQRLGPDAYNGAVALAQCKHQVALANATVAKNSKQANYRLAGLWVEVVTLADMRKEAEARKLFPELISADEDIQDEAGAEGAMRKSLQRLAELREEHDQPPTCKVDG